MNILQPMNLLINRLQHLFTKHFLVLNTLVVFIYVWTTLPFYSLPYEVPDYYKYYGFALEKLPAKDGFSSLFIAISQHLMTHYSLAHWGSLVLLSISLWLFNYSFYLVNKEPLKWYLFLFFSYSIGSWYYLYGKVFYEFPFIAITFAILLFFAKDFIAGNSELSHRKNKALGICFLLAGFCLSWKAHAVFPLIGLFGLMLLNPRVSRYICSRKIIGLGILFIAGFLFGNFNLLIDFFGTIQGIRGYKTTSNVMEFLFSDNMLAWDHINLLSFNLAIYWVPSILFILFIAPLFASNSRYVIFLNLFLCIFFLAVMGVFLSGLTWQGFPFSLYFMVLVFYVLSTAKFARVISPLPLLLIFCMGFQYFHLFNKYLPLQIEWSNATNQAIEQLQKNDEQILADVNNIIQRNGRSYRIDLRLKRNWPLNFNNALQQQNPEGWNPIFKSECFAPCIPTYQILIEPLALRELESYQKIDKPEIGGMIQAREYRIVWKNFDQSFIDQEIHLLK